MMRRLSTIESIKTFRSLNFLGMVTAWLAIWLVFAQRIAGEVSASPDRVFNLETAFPLLLGNLSTLGYLFVGALASYFTAAEYSVGTARYMVTQGVSRAEMGWSKLIQAAMIAGIVAGLTVMGTIVLGWLLSDGSESLRTLEASLIFSGLYGLGLLQMGAFGTLVGTLMRNQGLAPLVFLGYVLLLEDAMQRVLAAADLEAVSDWLPASAAPNMLDAFSDYLLGQAGPAMAAALPVLAYLLIAAVLTIWAADKRDL